MRNRAIDSLKGILILLVVFGHLIEPLIDSSSLFKSLYLFIYSFHIPLFVGISGYLTSGTNPRKSIPKIASTLLLFTVLYEIFELATTGHTSKYPFAVVPYWIMWYLYSLVCWRAIIPLIRNRKRTLVISIVISLFMGYIPFVGYALGLSRTLFFFPIFLIGYMLNERNHLTAFRLPRIMAFTSLGVLLVVPAAISSVNEEWFYGSYHYAHFGVEWWQGPLFRIGVYALACWGSWTLLSLVRTGNSTLQKVGRHSIAIYVWHGFAIKILVQTLCIEKIGTLQHIPALALLLLITGITTVLLSSNRLFKVTNQITDRIFTALQSPKLFKRNRVED